MASAGYWGGFSKRGSSGTPFNSAGALGGLRTWSVERMRPGARGFLLVVFGPPERASAIAAVDPDSGEVFEAAHLPGRERQLLD